MSEFVPNQIQTRKGTSSEAARTARLTSTPGMDENTSLQLLHAMGNHAVLRMVQSQQQNVDLADTDALSDRNEQEDGVAVPLPPSKEFSGSKIVRTEISTIEESATKEGKGSNTYWFSFGHPSLVSISYHAHFQEDNFSFTIDGTPHPATGMISEGGMIDLAGNPASNFSVVVESSTETSDYHITYRRSEQRVFFEKEIYRLGRVVGRVIGYYDWGTSQSQSGIQSNDLKTEYEVGMEAAATLGAHKHFREGKTEGY